MTGIGHIAFLSTQLSGMRDGSPLAWLAWQHTALCNHVSLALALISLSRSYSPAKVVYSVYNTGIKHREKHFKIHLRNLI